MADPRIRPAQPEDVPAIVGLVHELALYEKLPEECHLTDAQLHAALFAPAPALFGHVALVPDAGGDPAPGTGGTGDSGGTVVGYALHFLNYSTWEGVHGIYLEDLFVQPDHRGTGLGRALLANLAEIADRNGYARVEWSVLDWNRPSIDFYASLGAFPMEGWSTFRLTGDPLTRLAARSAALSDPAAGTG
ncbi:GNAT family N-acetyltransferase [Nakamurella endophytica]|uniref:N-acetyltransferase n=1 Tax=Nakamurella endophytica TaxID=1748367 RepID=A0A917SLN1_9ACTN|nr:GNAT family N-acetyltransferase [Nakamurella endophytica]GGL85787.1 N-acetyltransferase [Nakamurella endophytica]